MAVAQSQSPRLKSSEAYRTISEVAADLDLPQHVLRFWETRFPQIRPMKKGGGRRYYRSEDVDIIKGIRAALHGSGLTIRGVLKIMKEQGVSDIISMGHTPQFARTSFAGLQNEEEEDFIDMDDTLPSPLTPKIKLSSIFTTGLNTSLQKEASRPALPPKKLTAAPSFVKFSPLEDEPEDLPAFMSSVLPSKPFVEAAKAAPSPTPLMQTRPKFAPLMQDGLSVYDMQQLQFALNELVECRKLLD